MRKAGGRVRITAQLVQARDGFHMWSQSYDRELTTTNIFDIPGGDSSAGAARVEGAFAARGAGAAAGAPTQDIEAYQTYLKANQLVVDRNIDEMEAAIELYKEALRMDPAFASAHARLAIAYNLQRVYGNTDFLETKLVAKYHADAALNIDSNLAEGYAAIGMDEWFSSGNLRAAVEAFEKGLALNPNFISLITG